jgi:hypothetical protein
MNVKVPYAVTGAVVWLIVSGCQAPAGPAATATQRPPTSTVTPVPATATLTPAPATATATATMPPTRTASPLPPVPTANFAPADIAGTWTRTDAARGKLFITFNSGGNYNAAHGSPQDSVHAGAFTLDGRLLTVVDGWNCAPAEPTPGQYVLRLAGGGQWLYFDLYVDTCPDRPAALTGFRWDRYVAP